MNPIRAKYLNFLLLPKSPNKSADIAKTKNKYN